IAEIRRRNLVEPIQNAINQGKPFLGICLGLQLLFDIGHEGGRHEGLGILRGEVVRFEVPAEFKVPHMGWNRARTRHRPPIFKGLPDDPYFYFVHSYYVVPREDQIIATETDYAGDFCSMIWRENLFATQFHPEKSQADGLQLLQNFAEL
ncbi:MAG TPA: imidazole glycerol phosphate synthase subunit HisH, partial [Pirellulales bacterium]|nr:imidazole glycerol phosphate synthase subunit HisH [Pirellulales bacterium]